MRILPLGSNATTVERAGRALGVADLNFKALDDRTTAMDGTDLFLQPQTLSRSQTIPDGFTAIVDGVLTLAAGVTLTILGTGKLRMI